MIPTFADVFAKARKLIGDTETSGGTTATDSMLLEYGSGAYELLFSVLKNIESPRIRRTAYWRIPAYASYLNPAHMAALGLPPMGELINIWDRPEGQLLTIDSLTATAQAAGDLNPYVDIVSSGLVTASPNVTDGSFIDITACNTFTADVNDEWCVLRTETDTIRLVGCQATALSPITPSTGVILTSPGPWPTDPINRVLNQRDLESSGGSSVISRWLWSDGAIRFRPCSTPRHLRIEYRISPLPPTSTSVSLGVQDSLNFLAAYTAGLFLTSKGTKGSATEQFLLAVGDPTGEAGTGAKGYLGQLTRQHMKSEQRVRLISPRFRPKRNTSSTIRF